MIETKEKQNQNGITLIALVVTIVILLILAGITVNLILGEGNIFEKAQEAKEKHEDAQVKENAILEGYQNTINEYADGSVSGSRDTVTIDKEEYDNLLERVETLENSKKTILIEKKWQTSTVSTTANVEKKIDEISLSGYGTGKAIVSFSAGSETNNVTGFHNFIRKNDNSMVAMDGVTGVSSGTYKRACSAGTTSYDENTTLLFSVTTSASIKPIYNINILLIPD